MKRFETGTCHVSLGYCKSVSYAVVELPEGLLLVECIDCGVAGHAVLIRGEEDWVELGRALLACVKERYEAELKEAVSEMERAERWLERFERTFAKKGCEVLKDDDLVDKARSYFIYGRRVEECKRKLEKLQKEADLRVTLYLRGERREFTVPLGGGESG